MSEFKKYIQSILNDIDTDKKIKQDIEDEIEDHLSLSKQKYINGGYSEREAIEMAMKSFGDANKIKSKYSNVYYPFNNIVKLLAGILFLPYIFLFIWVSFFKLGYNNHSINIVPFNTILQYLTDFRGLTYGWFDVNSWIDNLFGMIIAFVPYGLLTPIIFHKRINKLYHVIFAAISCSLFVELLQHLTARGTADIDDILLSTIGSILGYVLLKFIMKSINFLKKTTSNVKIVETDNAVRAAATTGKLSV